jgi:probable F420-dependent oxidoreductase
MTPFFDPGPNPYGNPKILLAAVGELMTEVAGENGDGLLVHGFTTERYLREVSLPALERGAARAGKTRADLTVSYPGFVVTGATDADVGAADAAVRQQIAFYGSTPAYRPVLELHGWGDLHPELNTLSKRGEWVKMGELISDEVLDAFAVVCPIDQVAAQVKARFGDVVDRFSFYAPYKMEPEQWSAVLEDFHTG